jgi:hypothetical protein
MTIDLTRAELAAIVGAAQHTPPESFLRISRAGDGSVRAEWEPDIGAGQGPPQTVRATIRSGNLSEFGVVPTNK